MEEAIKEGAPIIHEDKKNNIIASSIIDIGNIDDEFKNADHIFGGEYETSIVQHCQLENQTAYAYVDSDNRIVIVTSTQIPHIVRRIVGQTLNIPWGRIRVIKPSDTVFSQMVAEVLGINIKDVHIISTQDTDITPFDTGAYASRQTFVTGAAVKKEAFLLKLR